MIYFQMALSSKTHPYGNLHNMDLTTDPNQDILVDNNPFYKGIK